MSARIDRLEAEVTAAEDISAIRKLQRAYGYYLDKGLWADLIELFSDDARANYPAGVFVGKESIRQHLFQNFGTDGKVGFEDGRLYNHMVLQPVIHLDSGARTAKGRWRVWGMMGRLGGSAQWADGAYEMTYVKDANGTWKIGRLDYQSGFGASYDGGWTAARGGTAPASTPANTAAPSPARRGRPALAHPPDLPREETCSGYPAACVPPMHFKNPVTGGSGAAWTTVTLDPARKVKGDDNQRLAELTHRAERLADEQAVENLQAIYGYYMDRHLWDDAAALFSTTGTLEIGAQGLYSGPKRIRAYLGLSGPVGLRPGELYDHMQLQTIVSVAPDGKTAALRSRHVSFTGNSGGQGFVSEGVYENRLVKENGVWKFASVRLYPTFVSDYAKGWGKDALAARGPSTDLAPDRTQTDNWMMYPKFYIPPFHFANPGSGKPVTYPEGVTAPSPFAGGKTSGRTIRPRDAAVVLTTTEAIIGRVKDGYELENLEDAYGYYLDKNLWTDLADLVAPSGSMELAQRGVYRGQDRVRAFLHTVFGEEGPKEGRLGNHIQMQPVIHVAADGKTARIRIRLLQQMGTYGGRGSWGAGIYENEAVKEDGVWKFKSLHMYNTFTAPYEGGWTSVTGPARVPGPSANFPPDAPPTLVFSMFPAVYDIPFHYRNPATGK